MGEYAIQAPTATHDQPAQPYPGLKDAALWGMVGVTPMIGVNDDNEEIFTTEDADKLTSFAVQNGLGRLAMWSLNRDGPCPAPTQWTSNTCSSPESRSPATRGRHRTTVRVWPLFRDVVGDGV